MNKTQRALDSDCASTAWQTPRIRRGDLVEILEELPDGSFYVRVNNNPRAQHVVSAWTLRMVLGQLAA